MVPAPPGDGGPTASPSSHLADRPSADPAPAAQHGGRSSLRTDHPTELLRLAAVGSVDDGKSTLIGRLLHDTRQLFDDQLEALSLASRRRGARGVDLAYVTDGLRAEREQGITIDVAYRYASTPNRKLVIADCPGHVQYTRNMATGASTADLVVVVVDASTGLREQTRRHCCIAALLGVRHMVVAVNKMDLVAWDRARYSNLERELSEFGQRLGMQSVVAVPVCATEGDNVASSSARSTWYSGPTVLEALEQAEAGAWAAEGGSTGRLPVQWVVRNPGGGRSYAGMISGGPLHAGDPVVVLPGGSATRIAAMSTFDGRVETASARMSVTVDLEDDLDVSRGDMISSVTRPPEVVRELDATLCWFGDHQAQRGRRVRVKHTTRLSRAELSSVRARLDISSMSLDDASSLSNNDIGIVRVDVAIPLAVDPYRTNRVTGSFIVIDEATNATVAAGMVGEPAFASG